MISIVIVNWNGLNFLPDCLLSISKNPPTADYEVVVVDNASNDGSREWLISDAAKDIFPVDTRFIVILGDENIGFGRANNLAFGQIQSEYVFILNPDTLVTSSCIDGLISVLDEGDIGAVAPRLLNDDGSLQPSTWYWPPTPLKILTEVLFRRFIPKRFLRKYLWFQYWEHNEVCDVPVVWGAAILFKRDTLDSLGGFDDEIFMYGEDIDICVRLHRMRKRLVFVPQARIIHSGGRSAEQSWNEEQLNVKKSAAGYFVEKKHLRKSLFLVNMLVRLGIEVLRFFTNPLRSKPDTNIRARMKAIWTNVKLQ